MKAIAKPKSRKKLKTTFGLESAGTLMTPEEFDAAEDWDELYKYEVIHGVLVVTPPPLEAEHDPNGELEFLLRLYQHQHPQVAALDKTMAEEPVRTLTNRRRADRVIWAGLGRLPNIETDPPTIVIEFVSRGKRNRQRDYDEKRKEYADVGIVEYWIIDRFERIMTVHQSAKGKVSTTVVKEAEIYQTPLLPGFELPLARLLALADVWNQ
jgi:Uma2 family endonuclease